MYEYRYGTYDTGAQYLIKSHLYYHKKFKINLQERIATSKTYLILYSNFFIRYCAPISSLQKTVNLYSSLEKYSNWAKESPHYMQIIN